MIPYNKNNIKERHSKPFVYERIVEINWLKHKMSQIPDLKNTKLFDFGCNKAEYIKELKKQYGLETFGIDLKKPASKFVDHFYLVQFNEKFAEDFRKQGPIKTCTAISAVEHAGAGWKRTKNTTRYQRKICAYMIEISEYFFLSVPYGKRPGWALDVSRTNLRQFDIPLLENLKKMSEKQNKHYMEEIYKFEKGYWYKSDRHKSKECIYRSNKQGASAVALISVYK